jgi:CTP synthase
MRLGAYPCHLGEKSLARRIYGQPDISERHRHRFEFNNAFKGDFEKGGMVFSGMSPDGKLVEIAEVKDHPFMVGSQFHPEFLSRPMRPHPLFVGFVKAAKERKNKNNGSTS